MRIAYPKSLAPSNPNRSWNIPLLLALKPMCLNNWRSYRGRSTSLPWGLLPANLSSTIEFRKFPWNQRSDIVFANSRKLQSNTPDWKSIHDDTSRMLLSYDLTISPKHPLRMSSLSTFFLVNNYQSIWNAARNVKIKQSINMADQIWKVQIGYISDQWQEWLRWRKLTRVRRKAHAVNTLFRSLFDRFSSRWLRLQLGQVNIWMKSKTPGRDNRTSRSLRLVPVRFHSTETPFIAFIISTCG